MPSAGPNDSISPNTRRMVNDGAMTQFTVTPNAGYVTIVGKACGSPLAGTT
jgi:hypothetical protein